MNHDDLIADGISKLWTLPKLTVGFSADGLTSLQNVLVDSHASPAPSLPQDPPRQPQELMLNKYFMPPLGNPLLDPTYVYAAGPLCDFLILTLLTGLPSFRTTYHLRNSSSWPNHWSSTESPTCSCQNQIRQNLVHGIWNPMTRGMRKRHYCRAKAYILHVHAIFDQPIFRSDFLRCFLYRWSTKLDLWNRCGWGADLLFRACRCERFHTLFFVRKQGGLFDVYRGGLCSSFRLILGPKLTRVVARLSLWWLTTLAIGATRKGIFKPCVWPFNLSASRCFLSPSQVRFLWWLGVAFMDVGVYVPPCVPWNPSSLETPWRAFLSLLSRFADHDIYCLPCHL